MAHILSIASTFSESLVAVLDTDIRILFLKFAKVKILAAIL